jgi:cobalamin transport system ATP-binding protein
MAGDYKSKSTIPLMPETGGEHIMELDGFSIGFQQGEALLDSLRLTVNPGEMVALIGRNGSGKSTLLKSMIGLLSPLAGECLLEGRPFGDYSLPERARRVSFVSSQLTQLPSLTVRELVALGRMPHTGWTGRLTQRDLQLIEQALNEVQMSALMERKLDCLSDGERQRAMIARAFVQDAPLMVLDEPTAFLDIPNTYDLIALLSRFRNGGRSIVYSTHDLETAMLCADKMWVIHEGSIQEGAPEDLGLSGLFDDLFASSGIRFDEGAGRFMFSKERRAGIALEGKAGKALTWTRSTLERLGYRVEAHASLGIYLESHPGGNQWILIKKGDRRAFQNLYSLARFLKEEQ